MLPVMLWFIYVKHILWIFPMGRHCYKLIHCFRKKLFSKERAAKRRCRRYQMQKQTNKKGDKVRKALGWEHLALILVLSLHGYKNLSWTELAPNAPSFVIKRTGPLIKIMFYGFTWLLKPFHLPRKLCVSQSFILPVISGLLLNHSAWETPGKQCELHHQFSQNLFCLSLLHKPSDNLTQSKKYI